MTTYTAFNFDKPDGSVDTGPNFSTNANANDRALMIAILQGQEPSYAFSKTNGTGSDEEPQYYLWSSGAGATTKILRATNTWTSGNLTQQVWEWSTDNGSTYASICTQTFTYSSGNLTATTNAGGMLSVFYYLLGKVKSLLTSFNSHTGGNGTAVHGLGTISTQAASNVALTGGAIDGTTIGATTRANGSFTLERETAYNAGNITGSVTLNWNNGGYQYGTITGITTLSWSNLPPSGLAQGLTLELTNPGNYAVTWPTGVKWPGGTAPTRTSNGIDLYEFVCRDGSTVRGAQAQKDTK